MLLPHPTLHTLVDAQENFDALTRTVWARVTKSSTQSITNATVTKLTFDSESFDTDGIFDPATNTRLTCQTSGLYLVELQVGFVVNGTGVRFINVVVNGTEIERRRSASAGAADDTELGLSVPYPLARGDVVEAQAYQTSGGALNVSTLTHFSMARLGA